MKTAPFTKLNMSVHLCCAMLKIRDNSSIADFLVKKVFKTLPGEPSINCLDVSATNELYISYLNKPRWEQRLDNNNELYDNVSSRFHGKPAKVLRKMFGDLFNAQQYEEFATEYKRFQRGLKTSENQVVIVHGEDVRKYYLRENYTNEACGQLGNSCMGGFEQQKFLDMYVENPNQVGLAVAFDSESLVAARALVWYDADKNPLGIDRIYNANDYWYDTLKNWADHKGLPSLRNSQRYKVYLENPNHEYYPYCDTMQYMIGNRLQNYYPTESGTQYYSLHSTGGSKYERFSE